MKEPNAILLKELRSMTREPRFLVLHMLVVLAVSFVAVAMAATAERMFQAGFESWDAARAGQQFYFGLQTALVVAVVVLVPGFAATAVTSEKDKHTFDLMISCATGPLEIVWGKFLAVMVVVLLCVGSAVPFLAMASYFGGVSPVHVAGFSTVLVLFAALLVSVVIYISSTFESSTWATLWSYIASFFVGLCFAGFLALMANIPVVREFYGLVGSGQETPLKGIGVGAFLAGWLVPVSISLWLTAYLFTSTAVMIDRLPVYRLGRSQAFFRWIQERGLALLAGVAVVSFALSCAGV